MVAIKKSIRVPIKGLDISAPGTIIDPRATPNVSNMQISRSIIEKRPGTDALGASLAERLLGMIEFESGGTTFFVRAGLSKFELLNKTTNVWTDKANAALTAAATAQMDFAFITIGGTKYVVYTNNTDAIRKYNGTGNDADLGGTPPACKYMVGFGGYLMLLNVGGAGQLAQWSDSGDPEDWSTGNAGQQSLLEDNEDITGGKAWGDFITVHKESSIYLAQIVSTAQIFRFDRKETGSGAVAFQSIQNLPTGEQVFLARDGIRLFDGVTAPLIPSPINDELRESMNPERVDRSVSVIVRELDEYWVGIPIGIQTEPETIYKYNYRTGQLYKDFRSGHSIFSLSKVTSQEAWDDDAANWDSDLTTWNQVTDLALHKRVIFGSSTGLVTRKSTDPNDNGVAIDGLWETKDYTITDINPEMEIGTLVRWEGFELWAKGNGVTVYYSTDEGSTWNNTGDISLDSDFPPDDDPDIVYFDVVSTKIRFRLRNDTLGESFSFKQFWVLGIPREARG